MKGDKYILLKNVHSTRNDKYILIYKGQPVYQAVDEDFEDVVYCKEHTRQDIAIPIPFDYLELRERSVVQIDAVENRLNIEIKPEPKYKNRFEEIMELVCQGNTFREIGVILKISPRTVETHIEKGRKLMRAKTLAHMAHLYTKIQTQS